jgi:hypothetical protein
MPRWKVRPELVIMDVMRAAVVLALVGCSYAPKPADGLTGDGPPVTGDGPQQPDTAPPLSDTVRMIDLEDVQIAGGPHLDFPLLVRITEDYLRDAANGGDVVRSEGFDIYFSSDAAGTQRLAHEVESYDRAAGALLAWVKLPSLSASTVLFLHYGSTEITSSQENIFGVWSGGYELVLHLDGPADATGKASAVSAQITGTPTTPLDRGHQFDGSDDRLLIDSTAANDIFVGGGTAEAWFLAESYGENGFGRLFDKGHTAGWSMALNDGNATKTLAFVHGSVGADFGEWNGPANAIDLNKWQHAAIVYDNSSNANLPIMYVDGVPLENVDVFDPATGTMDSDVASALFVGNRQTTDRTFAGQLDELRLSSITRSADWMLTQFRNQLDAEAFYTVGDPL